MKLLLLGTGGYYPTPQRQTSCFYLPESGVILDAGTGLWRLGKARHLPHFHLFLSHGHLDHSVGLVYLPGILRNKGVETVTVWADRVHGEEVINRLFGEPVFPRSRDDLPFTLEVRNLENHHEVASLQVDSTPTPHGLLGSRAIRVTNKNSTSVVLMTDTHASSQQVEFCRNADVLLADCYLRSNQSDHARAAAHSTPRLMAQLAKAANVKQLVLVHINPLEETPRILMEEAREIFPNTLVGEDEMDIDVGGHP